MKDVYLDNSATTRICEEALKEYIRASEDFYGNPSSLHTLGYNAEKLIGRVRDEINSSLAAKGATVVFTASGSEANNLAIIGRAEAKERYARGAKIITTDGEHASVTEPLSRLEKRGFRIVKIPTRGGAVDLGMLKKELTADVILVTMMMVNNETGALYDVKSAADLTHRLCPDALFHVDATQSYMKIPFTKASVGADMITVSSHKIEGPKGVGALVLDERVLKTRGLSPLILGGGQEGGLRSGTENVPAIAAFGAAVRVGRAAIRERYATLGALRDYLLQRITSEERLKDLSLTLPDSHAPHILNLTLPNIRSETMLHYLSSLGIYVSSGSACSSNSGHISSALVAFGRSESEADHSIRISLSHRNSREDIDALTEGLISGVERLARVK